MYRADYVLKAGDVDRFRRLRLSVLLHWMQEACITHTEQLGMGRARTLDRGLLWVLSRVSVRIARLPVYDEAVTLETMPGETMHLLFPRYCRLLDAAGTVLAEADMLWLLIDAESRRPVSPEEYGIVIAAEGGRKAMLPPSLPPADGPEQLRTVRYSEVDLNGHMNNTRYADWAEDLLGGGYWRTHRCTGLQINYQKEAREEERLVLRSHTAADGLHVSGWSGGQRVFDLLLGNCAAE